MCSSEKIAMEGFIRVRRHDALAFTVLLGLLGTTACSKMPFIHKERYAPRTEILKMPVPASAWTFDVSKTLSLEDVVKRFGPPLSTDEASTLLGRFKVIVYNSDDEFGNPAACNLKFWYQEGLPQPWRLVGVDFSSVDQSNTTRR
jgi:hypothetical protein